MVLYKLWNKGINEGKMRTPFILKTLLIAGISFFALSGCTDEIQVSIENNIQALQQENLKKYLATISKKSPAYESLQATLPQIFETFDMDYKIVSVEVIEKREKKVEPKKKEVKKEGEEGTEDATTEEENKGEGDKGKEKKKAGVTEIEPVLSDDVDFGETPKPTPVPVTRIGTAKVRVVQVTKKRKGAPVFANNEMTIVHEMIIEDNIWKIYKSEREGVAFL